MSKVLFFIAFRQFYLDFRKEYFILFDSYSFFSQKYQKDLSKNKFFLITDEPQQNTQEHRFWEEMKDVPSFEMIPSDKAEKVAEVVENTGASKFL